MERINFAKPGVTVIVGHNGSGKTTIVECLKYATTGDQPPNTRGGAFVHDPKMAHEKEVKAQVKLRFYARNGVRMTATRNLMVTAKKNGLTMKTLESLLDADNPNGGNKRSTISTKCAEIDAEIPNLLGVSKSVLENVIFCHQEDSYWPLAEPSILKKKFDDIFEATKYTKALDNIKSIRKERVAELKVEKERLDSLATERKHAEKLNTKISDLTNVIEEKETQIEALKEEEKEVGEDNHQYYQQSMLFKQHYMRADELENRKRTDKEDARNIEESLRKDKALSNMPDEALQGELDSFERTRQEKEGEVRRLQKHIEEGKEREASIRRKLRTVTANRGILQGDAQRHEEDTMLQNDAIHRLGETYSISGYDADSLDDDGVNEFFYKLKALLRKHTLNTESIQNDLRAKTSAFLTQIADQRSQISTLSHERDSAHQQITQLQSSIARAESVVDQNKALESEIKFNADDLADKQARQQKLVTEFATARYDDTINAKAKEMRSKETEREDLHAEQNRVTLQANDRAKLEVKKGDLKKKQAAVERILETHSAKFRTYFEVDAQPESMEADLDHLISVKTRELTRLETEYNKANRESAEVHNTHERSKKELADMRDNIKKLERKLHEAANQNSEEGTNLTIDEAIRDAQLEIDDCQEEATRIVNASVFYKKFLEEGRKNKKCSVCDRKLAAGKEMDAFEKTASRPDLFLQAKIVETTDEKIKDNAEQMEVWKEELSRLQRALPMQSELAKLTKELPKLEKTVKEQADQDSAAAAAAEKAGSTLKDAKATIGDLNALREHARNVTRTNEEVNTLRTEIAQLERGLQSTGSTRTFSDIQEEIDDLGQKIKNLDREKQLIQTQKDQQLAAQRTIENEIHAMEMKASQLEGRLLEGRNAAERMEQDKEALVRQRSKLPTLSTRMSALQSKIAELEGEQKEQERLLSDKLAVAQEQLQVLNTSALELDAIHARVEKYKSENRAQELEDCTRQAAELEEQLSQAESALDAIRGETAAIQKEIDQGGARLSMLRDNLRLRRLKRRIEETEIELASLPMEEAANSRRTFEVKWAAMQKRERDIKTRIAMLTGEVSTMKAQIDGYKRDLLHDYKNIAKRYMDQLVRVKMSDMANNDLEKYAKALDNAIMKYHSLKMAEVNDTMRHLWNKTYQGTDIDGIMIRSEGEGENATTTTKRSYNYRVVMTKDQVEMDMRGRCSAGQKMLASIIIRLALSDSFGQECGILALDEPTNALDVENIEALAASLVEIINERKRAANFQLIIITHDENFLRKLGESGVIQDYWRVTRSDNQKSIIEKHMLL